MAKLLLLAILTGFGIYSAMCVAEMLEAETQYWQERARDEERLRVSDIYYLNHPAPIED